MMLEQLDIYMGQTYLNPYLTAYTNVQLEMDTDVNAGVLKT